MSNRISRRRRPPRNKYKYADKATGEVHVIVRPPDVPPPKPKREPFLWTEAAASKRSARS